MIRRGFGERPDDVPTLAEAAQVYGELLGVKRCENDGRGGELLMDIADRPYGKYLEELGVRGDIYRAVEVMSVYVAGRVDTR